MADQSRLDVLEGRMEEQSRNWNRLFSEVGRLDQKIDDSIAAKIGGIDARLDAINARFDGVHARLDDFDQKFDRKIDDLRGDLMKQFRWTIGVMVTLSMGLLTAILTR